MLNILLKFLDIILYVGCKKSPKFAKIPNFSNDSKFIGSAFS